MKQMPLSYSQISLYQRCPRQYEFAVIKKIARPISKGESFGSSVHNTLKKWGDLELVKSGKKETGSDQLALFLEEKESSVLPLTAASLQHLWHQSFIVGSYDTRTEADFARARGEKLMEHFFQWWSSELRTVVAIEKGFSLNLGNIEISGRFDRIEECGEGIRIIDYKTGAPRTQDQIDSDLQLSLYAAAAQELFGKPCTELVLLFLYEEECIERRTLRNAGQIADAGKQITMIRERIDAKDFHPTPSKEKCTYCPYRNVCDAAAV